MTYLNRETCDPEALHADTTQLQAAGAHAFASFLEAEHELQCAGDAERALRTLRELRASARPYARSFELVYIEALLHAGAYEEAKQHMLAALAEQDLGVIGLLQLPAAGALPLTAAKALLEAYVERSGGNADIGVRAALAEICARAADADCARFHATRAAVRGRPTNALSWLAEHHEDERVRTDAARWLEVLRHTEPAAAMSP